MARWTQYLARSSDHGYQTCSEHLSMTGCLDGAFASQFGELKEGLITGLLHDVGKYSDEFQSMIREVNDDK